MWWSRLRALLRHRFGRSRADHSIDEEIQSYLQMETDAKIHSGLSPDSARRVALVEFGGIDQVKESIRDVQPGVWLDAFLQDARNALKTLRRTAAFSCSIVVSLALGLAAMIAAVGFLDGLLFRPPSGIASPASLVSLTVDQRCGRYKCAGDSTPDEIQRLTQGVEGIARIAAEATAEVAIGAPDAQSVQATFVSDNFFDVLGVRLIHGRAFGANDEPHGAVIAHSLWAQTFGQDPLVIGRTMRVADVIVHVVGVAPREFTGFHQGLPQPGQPAAAIWLPLRLADRLTKAGRSRVRYVGHLDADTTVSAAQARLAVVANQFAQARGLPDAPFVEVRSTGIDPFRATAIILLVLSIPVAVLAIAAVNAASLLLARASRRGHEMAVRLALGARRGRLIQQLLVESLILSLLATTVSLPAAGWGLTRASDFFGVRFSIDMRLVAIALLVAAVTSVGFGLVPALTVSAQRPVRTLGGHGGALTPRRVRTRKGLVVAQVAVSIALLAVGSQLVTSFGAINATRAVDPNHVLMASLDLRQVNMADDDIPRFYEALVDRVSTLDGVDATGAGSGTAFWRFNASDTDSTIVWRPEDAPGTGNWHRGSTAIGDLFGVVGARVLQGRVFTPDDSRERRPRVAVVNRVFAETQLGGTALGRSVRVAKSKDGYATGTDVTIVGIIDPTWTNEDGVAPPRSAIYLPAPLESEPALTLYVRTRQSAAITPRLRDAVRQIDSRVPFLQVATLVERSSRAYPESWLADAAGVLGMVALVLATFGLAALVSYLVTLRSREIAVRLALGARPVDVLRMVMTQALRLSALGAVIGVPVALVVGQFVRAEFHQALGIDLASLGISLSLLVGAALAASAIPAFRASCVSPATLLKEQ